MDELYLFKSQDEGNRLLYAYYKGEFWFYDPNVQQWYISGHVREQYELEAQKDISLTPDDFICTGYGYELVAEYEVPVAALDALWAAKKVLPPEPASVEVPLPKPGDMYRSPKSGQLYKIGELTNGKKTCYLTMRSNAQGGTWVPVNSSVYPKLSDAQGEFEAWIRTEQLEPVAPTGDAAATTDGSAATEPSQAAETLNASPAKEGDASSSRSAEPAPQAPAASPLSAPDTAPMSLPAFDYTGLDAQTVQDLHLAEREFAGGKRMAEIGLRRMADGVAIAHDALCGSCDIMSQLKHGDRGEASFGRWCDSVGLNRKAAERLLQVSKLFDNSSPRQQKALEELGPTLLYAAAKPSAPAELVQAVKDGDITTHKQYQEALARIRTLENQNASLLHSYETERGKAEAADRRADKAEQTAKDTARERDTALRRAAEAENRATAAENRAAGAQKLADQRGTENIDLRRKLKEAESRPIDIAVAEPSEADKERWRKEGEDRMAATLQDTVLKAHKAKITAENQVADLQEQLAAARPDADACQRTADTLYETTENLRLLLRTQLKLAQLPPDTYGKVVAHVLQAADALRDTVHSCAPADYTMDDEEEDFL